MSNVNIKQHQHSNFRTSVNSAPDVYCIDFAHAQLLRGKLGTAGNLSLWPGVKCGRVDPRTCGCCNG